MSENVNISNLEYPQQIELKKHEYTQNPNFRANDFERTPGSDKVEISNKTSDTTKVAIGIGIAGTIVTLGILGRKGKLGTYIKKLLGGKKNEPITVDLLEHFLKKNENKTLNELTKEEKNKLIELLNPKNEVEVKQKIEVEFEVMKDKKVSDVVDSVKKKHKELKEGVNETPKSEKPEIKTENKTSEGGTEKTKTEGKSKKSSGGSSSTGSSSSSGSSGSYSTGSSISHTSSSGRSRKTSGGSRKTAEPDGETILNAQEEILKAKKASDARNNEWVKQQHEIKEKEYSDFWNKALAEQYHAEELSAAVAEERKLAEQARRIAEGKQRYAELNEKLNGRTSIRINKKKNQELADMGKYYHDIELEQARVLEEQIARRTEKIKWFDSYLQEEPLRKALGIADDAEIMFTEKFAYGKPYIKNQRGNIVTYDKDNGVWYEWKLTDIENWGERRQSLLSRTKKADGMIITEYKNQENGSVEYFIKNLETGTESKVINGQTCKKYPDGREEIKNLDKYELRKIHSGMDEFFRYIPPEGPKQLPYGYPKQPPAQFATVKAKKQSQTLNDIEAYVNSFDPGTFKRVNKTTVFYDNNGNREVVNIIYEGKDCDIDVQGRILPKLKVKQTTRNSQTNTSNYQTTSERKRQSQQRRMVQA